MDREMINDPCPHMPDSIKEAFAGAETIKALTELFQEGGRTYKEALAEAIRRYEEAQKIKNG